MNDRDPKPAPHVIAQKQAQIERVGFFDRSF
jgi:hypothetical protein